MESQYILEIILIFKNQKSKILLKIMKVISMMIMMLLLSQNICKLNYKDRNISNSNMGKSNKKIFLNIYIYFILLNFLNFLNFNNVI